jgi:hypothetical protein
MRSLPIVDLPAASVVRIPCAWLIALCLSATCAFAQSNASLGAPLSLADFEAGVSGAVRELEHDPRFKGLSEQQRRERAEFVAGNVLVATTHEVGHMLIAEMALPVLGHEEDAADVYATLTGLKHTGVFSERVLAASTHGWLLAERRDRKQGARPDYYDSHGLDRRRAYNIVCLLVGGDRDKFAKHVADTVKMPDDRQASCKGDFLNASWSWEKALAPHVRNPDQPRASFTVLYDESPDHAAIARAFREIRLLETLASHLSDRYAWRRPLGLEMKSCGEPNAYWNMRDRKITICYELAADFAELHRDYQAAN